MPALRAADVNLLKVPADLPDEKLVLLSDVLPTAWCALQTLQALLCSSRPPEPWKSVSRASSTDETIRASILPTACCLMPTPSSQ